MENDRIKIVCKRCGETFEDFADDYDNYWMSNLCDDCLIEMGEEEEDE